MVSIMGVKPAQNNLRAVRLVVTVGVAQQHKIRLLGDIDAFRGELEPDGQMQVVCKDRLLVRLAVAVGVLIDEELVVRHRIARAVVRIGRHHGHPETPLVIEGDLHGVGQIGEFLLTGKKLHLVPLGHRQVFTASSP